MNPAKTTIPPLHERMRAAVLVEPGRFELRELAVPVPGPQDVLIRVRRCGLCGTDIHIFRGHYSANRLPLVLGHEFSGTVAAIGADVRTVAPGQAVTADINHGCGACFYCRKNEILNCATMAQLGIHTDGALAEYVRVPARHVVPVPARTSIDLAALTEPVSCVVRAVRKSRLRLGESVLILGCGPIGNLHLQMALRVGAAPVIVCEPDASRARWARETGADRVVTDPDQLRDCVLAATEGRGADLVIESVGRASLYEAALDLVRPGGRVLAFGLAEPGARAHYEPFRVVLQELALLGSVAGTGDDMHEAMTLIAHDRLRLDAFVQTVYPLERIDAAMQAFIEDRSITKVQIALA